MINKNWISPLDARFWKSLKYEEVYLKAYNTVNEAIFSIGKYIWDYNNDRQHTALGDETPEEIYSENKFMAKCLEMSLKQMPPKKPE